MFAVKIDKYGGPEVLKIEKINLNKPEPNEVQIEHQAIGLNFIDTYHRSGSYPIELPSGMGGEGSGIIKKIGSAQDQGPGSHPAPLRRRKSIRTIGTH